MGDAKEKEDFIKEKSRGGARTTNTRRAKVFLLKESVRNKFTKNIHFKLFMPHLFGTIVEFYIRVLVVLVLLQVLNMR